MTSFVVLLLASSLCFAQMGWFPDPDRPKQVLTMHRIESPPTIDGDLSDEIWRALPRVTGTTDITFKHAYVPDQTLFIVAYDDKNLYIAIDVRDRFVDTIRATVKTRDENLWSAGDDVIELFFDPDGTGKRLVQIAFNPLGTQWDFRIDESGGATPTRWDGNWSVGVGRNAEGWTAEVVFPLADLPITVVHPGSGIKANLARTSLNRKREAFSSWSLIYNSFHSSGDYGTWIFGEPAASVGREDETKINSAFVATALQHGKSLATSADREIQIVAGRSESSMTEVKDQLARARERADQLRERLDATTELDGVLSARQAAFELEEILQALSNALCLRGLNGPIDGLALAEKAISETDDYWLMENRRGVYAIAKSSGAVAGIWDRRIAQRVVAASYDLYELETMQDTFYANEKLDRIETAERIGNVLILHCRNPLLQEVAIEKRYEVLNDGSILAKQVSVSQDSSGQRLLGISSSTLFDPAFRAGARYNRVMSAGSAGGSDDRPTIDALEITDDVIQRGGNNKACGYAQFVLANNATRTGISQYLYKIDGQYVWIPYAMPSSYWNALGWEISFLGTFLKTEPFSSEMRYHLFDGDQVEFYHEYLRLPEVEAARAELPVSRRMAGLASAGYGQPVTGASAPDFPNNMPRTAAGHARLRSDEINLMWGIPRHNISGEFPIQDDAELIWVNERDSSLVTRDPAGPVRHDAKIVKERYPKHLLGLYGVHTSINPASTAYREHPEFALQNKDTTLTSSTHFGSREFDADMSPAWTDYIVPLYAKFMDYFGMGFLYFDFFSGYSSPDWHDARVTQSTDFMYFDKSVRKIVAERDGILFFNGTPGQLYIDLTFIESTGPITAMDQWGPEWWRWHHERMMYYKLFERENMACMPLMWMNYKTGDRKSAEGIYDDNNREYTNMILALGFRPHPCYYEYDLELKREDGTIDHDRIYNYEYPYQLAALEMHNTRLSDVGLEPRYWTNPKSQVEAYVLKKGEAYFFTAINHQQSPADITTSALMDKLGLEPGKRLFRWNYTRRNDDAVPRRIGPETPGWDRLFTQTTCTSGILNDVQRLEITFRQAEVEFTYVETLSQVPAVFISKEGIETQFKLPEVLGGKLAGEVDEQQHRVELEANSPSSSVIAAWWPADWPNAQVQVNDSDLQQLQYRSFGKERFVLVPLAAGTSRIVVSPQP